MNSDSTGQRSKKMNKLNFPFNASRRFLLGYPGHDLWALIWKIKLCCSFHSTTRPVFSLQSMLSCFYGFSQHVDGVLGWFSVNCTMLSTGFLTSSYESWDEISKLPESNFFHFTGHYPIFFSITFPTSTHIFSLHSIFYFLWTATKVKILTRKFSSNWTWLCLDRKIKSD